MEYDRITNDSLQFLVLLVDAKTGEVLDHHNYFKEKTIPGKYVARGLAGFDDRIFVHFGVITDGSVPGRQYVRAYDMAWNELWEISLPNTFINPAWCDIEATPDGGMVAAYTSWDPGTRDRMGTIEKYDSAGTMEWQTNLPYRGDFDDWMRIDLHPDGYIGFWMYDTFGLYISRLPNVLYKLDHDGEIVWHRVENYYEFFELWDIFTTSNGDIVACGTAHNWLWPPAEPDYEGAFIIRFNADGERLWDRKILMDAEGVYWRALYSGAELDNGDLIFTGELCDWSTTTPENPTPCNVWVIKVDSMGCFKPDCGEFQDLVSTEEISDRVFADAFAVFPVPASEVLSIGARLGAHIPHGTYTMHLYDVYGRLAYASPFDPRLIAQIDVSQYAPGIYYLALLRDGRPVQAQKVSIVR